MLINWFLSSINSNKSAGQQKQKNSDLYAVALQFSSLLLSLGVIQQIIDKNAPKEECFKVSLILFWDAILFLVRLLMWKTGYRFVEGRLYLPSVGVAQLHILHAFEIFIQSSNE